MRAISEIPAAVCHHFGETLTSLSPMTFPSSPRTLAVDSVDFDEPLVARKAPRPGTLEHEPTRVISGVTATMLVVASMIGTGIFTTTGFLLQDIGSSLAVLLSWVFGGVIALFGALSYAELVAAMPRNGGEYLLLSRIYHPAVGFVAGWVSLVVGFSAPIAASALAFAVYFSTLVPGIDQQAAAIVLILLLSMVHAARVTFGTGLQNVFTVAKILVVVAFVVGGLFLGDTTHITEGSAGTFDSMLSPGFATGLIFVSFAYSGWNGAAYIAGEVKDPSRSLPKALALGTGIVTLLYLGLNVVFLSSAPASSLSGVIDVGNIAAVSLFGTAAAKLFSAVISLLLVSSVSAMIMAGPRVYQALGEDYKCFSFLTTRTKHSGPIYAVALQAFAAIIMLISASFDSLLIYIGFTLSVSAGLTVFGLFVMRRREPNLERPYRCWGYPLTPILFIALSCWMVIFSISAAPIAALAGLATIASGGVLYLIAKPSASVRR